MRIKRSVFVGIVVAMMALLVGGVVSAQDGGPRGGKGRQQRHPAVANLIHEAMGIVTAETGLTPQEVVQRLRGGATLAEVITANGGDVDSVIAQGVEMVTNKVNQALENGNISQEQADNVLADLETKITDIVNNPVPRDFLGGQRQRSQQDRRANPIGQAIGQAITEQAGLTGEEMRELLQVEGATIASVLTDNGVNLETFVADVQVQIETQLSEALAAGNITQEQYDNAVTDLGTKITNFLNNVPAHDGKDGQRPPQGHRGQQVNPLVRAVGEAVAEQTGLSGEEIRGMLQDGATLASILTDNGVSLEAFVADMTLQAQAQLDEALAEGKISQEQYDELVGSLGERLSNILNHVAGEKPDGGSL